MRYYLDTKWIRIATEGDYERALRQARGCYQRALLSGLEAWSGSTLGGKASQYSSHYRQSREALLERLEAAGLWVQFERLKHNRIRVFIQSNE